MIPFFPLTMKILTLLHDSNEQPEQSSNKSALELAIAMLINLQACDQLIHMKIDRWFVKFFRL